MASTSDPEAGHDAYVRLFERDPTLLARVDRVQAASLRDYGTVPSVRLEPGAWHPPTHRHSARQWLGLLVLEGFAARPVVISGRRVHELVGPGDLLRPWDHESWSGLVDAPGAWPVLAPTTLAVLDHQFAGVACRSTQLMNELLRRSLRRASQLAAGVSIAEMPELDAKVSALLGYLSERWGPSDGDAVDSPQLTPTAMAVVLQADRGAVAAALERLLVGPR